MIEECILRFFAFLFTWPKLKAAQIIDYSLSLKKVEGGEAVLGGCTVVMGYGDFCLLGHCYESDPRQQWRNVSAILWLLAWNPDPVRSMAKHQ